jgi:hypothetical protein
MNVPHEVVSAAAERIRTLQQAGYTKSYDAAMSVFAVLDEQGYTVVRKRGTRTQDERAKLETNIALQEQWIADHGENLLGYIERYGSANDATKYGDGGEAIYAADIATLNKLREQLRSL